MRRSWGAAMTNCPCRGGPGGRAGPCHSRCSSCAIPDVLAMPFLVFQLCCSRCFGRAPCPTRCVAFFLPLLHCEGGFLCHGVRRAGSILALFSCCPFEPAWCSSACARCDPNVPPSPGPVPALSSAASAPALALRDGRERRGVSRAIPVALPELSHGICTGECPP